MIRNGTILGGRYEIIDKIGAGGMSVVYKAKCKKLERYVAIKVLRGDFASDENFVLKFRVEAQSAASLSHPNIVNVYDVGNDGEVYYIVMEYIEGMTLKDYIQQKNGLTSEETLTIAKDIGEALKVAHQNNIIHRDIKPQNILVTKDGGVKVTDFGIARATTSSTITSGANAIGSVHYFSPEQARGGYVDEKSDLYSLGITMYEMITGTLPFQAESPVSVAIQHIKQDLPKPSTVNPNIWPVLESIIIKATQKRPEMRYQTAKQFVDDMERALQNPQENFIQFTNFNDSPTINMSKDDMATIKNKINSEKQINRNITRSNNSTKIINHNRSHKGNTRRQSSNKLIVTSAIITSILLIVVLAFFGLKLLNNFNKPKLITVPSIIDNNLNDAQKTLADIKLSIEKIGEDYDDNITEGNIIFQQPLENEKVEEGSTIKVKISKGIESFKVPDVVGKPYSEAKEILMKNNLQITVKQEFNDNVELGNVINQSPEALEDISKNESVELIVSKGPENKNVIVPNVMESTEDKAKEKLTDNNLTIGEITYSVHDKIKKGFVISQTIEPGEEVKRDSVVGLVISLGPEDNDLKPTSADGNGNNNSDKNVDNVEKETSKTINITDILEKGKDKQHMVIIIEDNKKRESIFDQEVTHKSFPITKTVTGTGTKKMEVYLDGNLKIENDIDFK